MAEIFVVKADEMTDGDRRIIKTPKGEIGLFRHEGAYYAYANHCPHSGGPACEGLLIPQIAEDYNEDKTYKGQRFTDRMNIVCPWHGWEYDMKTGTHAGDSRRKLKKYDVVERSGDIYVVT